MLLQGKVQRVTPPSPMRAPPTSPMQVSTVVLYHFRGIVGLVSRCQFHSCGELLEFSLLV